MDSIIEDRFGVFFLLHKPKRYLRIQIYEIYEISSEFNIYVFCLYLVVFHVLVSHANKHFPDISRNVSKYVSLLPVN